jgi:hypothetical protein
MLIAVPQKLNFGLACPAPAGKHSVVKKCPSETRRLKSPVRLTWGRHSKSRQRPAQLASQFRLSKVQDVKSNYWIGEKSRRGRLMPAAFVGDPPLVSEENAGGDGQPVFYGQTRFVLSPPLAVLCTATGRAASGTLPAPPSRMRAATRNASISAFKPEICAWKMAIWFSFSFIASYMLVIV